MYKEYLVLKKFKWDIADTIRLKKKEKWYEKKL